MHYTVPATSRTPVLIIFLLDLSGSMTSELDGAPKIDQLNAGIKNVLLRLVKRSTKGAVVSSRYLLGMFAYSDTVIDILGSVQTIAEVATKGSPVMSTIGTTDTYSAFLVARDLLRRELPRLNGCPAPVVCHITDGEYTGDDPEPVAQEIMRMRNDDGNVLIENVYLAPPGESLPSGSLARSWPGITEEEELSDAYERKLFRMSSLLPDSYARVVREDGFSLVPGARMFVPCRTKDRVDLAFAVSTACPSGASSVEPLRLRYPIKLFISYAREDMKHCRRLETYLSPLRMDKVIDVFSDGQITPGQHWDETVRSRLNNADLIILLISEYFAASDYISRVELKQSLEREKLGSVRVIPVILRPAFWQGTLGHLHALPSGGKPITQHNSTSAAWFGVAQGIATVVREIGGSSSASELQPHWWQ